MSEMQYIKEAKQLLNSNWNQKEGSLGFTTPCFKLYPAQWSWDSMFIAMGYATYDVALAIAEIDSFFLSQWSNGMLPHIVFHQENSDYFPGADFWDSPVSHAAPDAMRTSGIMQPPIHAMAIWQVYLEYKKQNVIAAKKWLEGKSKQLLAWHEYCYSYRDPEQSGLITIYHPWESGMDNSPRWDDALHKIEPVDMSNYTRHDTKVVDAKDRPSNVEYGRYLAIVEYAKRHSYDDEKLYANAPFKIKDIAISSLLAQANVYLENILTELHMHDERIALWNARTQKGLYEIAFNTEDAKFYDYDVITKKQIAIHSAATYMPFISNLLQKKEYNKLLQDIQKSNWSNKKVGNNVLLPSLAYSEPQFSTNLYWRGPVWFNVNWLVYKQLKATNQLDLAQKFADELCNLVHVSGFGEYFNPETLKSYGGKEFCWTAALYLEIMANQH